MHIPTIWSVSNPQIVIDTIHALGGHGISIGHFDETALDLKTADVIHIGQQDSVEILSAWIAYIEAYKTTFPHCQVIYTPQLVNTSEQLLNALIRQLMALSDVVILEKQTLTALSDLQIDIGTLAGTRKALQALVAKGVNAVIYKADAERIDMYIDAEHEYILSCSAPSERQTETAQESLLFATAFCTVLSQDYPIEDAFVVARAYINQPTKHGRCLGWPRQRKYFPDVVLPNSELGEALGLEAQMSLTEGFPVCDTQQLGLYPVVDSVEWLEKILKQGVKTLQLRIKDKTDAEVVADIAAAVALGKQYKARLFINDYWQLAIKLGAYGVHLGQEDMLVADFVAIKQAGLKLGLSTHGYYEILRAHAIKPSYIALGHIFPTVTKDMPSKPQGLIRLQRYADLMRDYPLVAIGGISLERAPQVAATGVGSIAVVTAITRAEDYCQAIADFQQVLAQSGIAAEEAVYG